MKPVVIGAMRQAVEIQTKPAIEAAEVDAHGQPIEVWTTIRECYAAIRPASGGERIVADQLRNEVSHVIETRWLQDIDPKVTRLKSGSRIFSIQGVINVDERSRVTRYYCREQV